MIIHLNQAVSSIKKRADKDYKYLEKNVSNSDGIVFDLNHYKRQKGVSCS